MVNRSAVRSFGRGSVRRSKMVVLEDLGTTHGRRKTISYWQQKDTMKDREGLKSTIPSGHGQSKGTGRSLFLDESDKPHERQIDGIRLRTTTVSVGNLHQTGSGSFNLGHRREAGRRGAMLPVAGRSMQGMMSGNMRTVQSHHGDQASSHRHLSIKPRGEIPGFFGGSKKKSGDRVGTESSGKGKGG